MQDITTLIQIIKEGYNLSNEYFEADIKKASSIDDVIGVMELGQLTGERLRDFYVDTDEIRDRHTILSLTKLLNNPLRPYTKVLFTGFMGAGKTTELVKLAAELGSKYNTIIFSVSNRVKLNDITIEALIFEIVEDALNYLLVNQLVDQSDPLLKTISDNIKKWCSQTRIITTDEEKAVLEGGGGIDLSALKLFFFKAKFESSAASGQISEHTLVEKRKLNDLIFECNKIFDYIKEKTGKKTVFIIDDLEKMAFIEAKNFYTQSSSFINMFRCAMILTIPIDLFYSSHYTAVSSYFDEGQILYMIKIKEKDGTVCTTGRQVLEHILAQRMDLDLFEDKCYEDAITYSGGSLRELFGIITRAVLGETGEKITRRSMERAILRYKDEFSSRIQQRHGENSPGFEDYLNVLFDIAEGNKEDPDRKPALLDLLRIRAVMKYNGEGFYDIHPLLDKFIQNYKNKRDRKKKS